MKYNRRLINCSKSKISHVKTFLPKQLYKGKYEEVDFHWRIKPMHPALLAKPSFLIQRKENGLISEYYDQFYNFIKIMRYLQIANKGTKTNGVHSVAATKLLETVGNILF